MSGLDYLQTYRQSFEHGGGRYGNVTVRAGVPEAVYVVPPAGEQHAFTRYDYPVEVQVSASPTGRSVQVFVNGKKVWPT